MSKVELGTSKFRDIIEWEKICSAYNKRYILLTKKSKIGFENTWYTLTIDIEDEIRQDFLNDIHECWKPRNLRHLRVSKEY